jgi:hypothetical protein
MLNFAVIAIVWFGAHLIDSGSYKLRNAGIYPIYDASNHVVFNDFQ